MKIIVFPRFQHHLFRAGLYAALVIVLYLSTSKIEGPLPGDLSDKFYHGLCFFVLGLLCDYAYPDTGFSAIKYTPLFLYGIGIEIIQYFIPYRSFSLADMLADALGLLAYGLFALALTQAIKHLVKPDAVPRR